MGKKQNKNHESGNSTHRPMKIERTTILSPFQPVSDAEHCTEEESGGVNRELRKGYEIEGCRRNMQLASKKKRNKTRVLLFVWNIYTRTR